MKRVLTFALLTLACVPQVSTAGMITFGGDLAGMLGGPLGTPALIGGGQTVTRAFDSMVVAGIGRVQGSVIFRNNATATAGDITLTDFVFESDKPANTAAITFSIDIDQDFTYAGGPMIDGRQSLNGAFTFTAGPQDGVIRRMVSSLERMVFPDLADVGMSGAGMFPQVDPIGPLMNNLMGIPAAAPIEAEMFLAMALSDNALGIGPRISLPSSAFLSYASEGEDFLQPIPEPIDVQVCFWKSRRPV
jgi:hypothetical protein